jgi:hypothetical protein
MEILASDGMYVIQHPQYSPCLPPCNISFSETQIITEEKEVL